MLIVRRLKTGIVIVLICILSLMFFVACNDFVSENNKRTIEEWFPILSPSIATVETSFLSNDRSGTAFVFKSTESASYLVTTFHTFSQAPSFHVNIVLGGRGETGHVIGYCAYHDIAVIKTGERVSAKALTVSQSSLDFGRELFSIGNALGNGISVHSGIASNPTQIINPQGGDNLESRYVPVSQISVPINHGMSGAPVFDFYGNVKGMAVATRVHDGTEQQNPVQGISYMIPIEIVQSIANQIILENPTGENSPKQVLALQARVVRALNIETVRTGQRFVLDLGGMRVANSNGQFIVTDITDAKRNQFASPTDAPNTGDEIIALGETNIRGMNIQEFLGVWHQYVDTRTSPIIKARQNINLVIHFETDSSTKRGAGLTNIRRVKQ
ncbi:MAG: S1C family serine protease [Firmicutes bacterium]|nr:S1C family serine protease [Bacillota bacterium]